jgi:pimeloyl-ACP methyl ester carboxylesterase
MPYAQLNGTTLHYDIVGKGTPLVFIHPIRLTGEVFCHQRTSLLDRFQIITFDIRGHGKSMYSEQPLTHTIIADDICALLSVLGIERAYLCGYSVGGQIVLEAMLVHPDRFLGAVLMSSMSELVDPVHRRLAWLGMGLIRLQGTWLKLLSAMVAINNADQLSTFKVLYDSCKLGNKVNIAQYHQEVLSYSCTARLGEIQAPILLLYGQRDTRFHRYAKELHTLLPNSTLHFIRGAPHQLPTKHAADLQGLLRLWLMDKAEVYNEHEYFQARHPYQDQAQTTDGFEHFTE